VRQSGNVAESKGSLDGGGGGRAGDQSLWVELPFPQNNGHGNPQINRKWWQKLSSSRQPKGGTGIDIFFVPLIAESYL
jgi:hypothetical protein